MSETGSATDLSRLHDIVEPAAVPWWPPAPGWYWLAAALTVLLALVGWRLFRRWKAAAYRRNAVRALATADSPAAIAAVLRRAALATHPRAEIAGLSGEAWPDWLVANGPEPPPAAVREQLVAGVYAPGRQDDIAALSAWAERWIRKHRSHAKAGKFG